MHKYMMLRGTPQLIRRLIEDLQKIYYKHINKKTGKTIGLVQLMPREIKSYEVVFPHTEKANVKADIEKVMRRVCADGDGIAIHWGPWKKDKFKEGAERL